MSASIFEGTTFKFNTWTNDSTNLTMTGNASVSGNFEMGTNKFRILGSSGNFSSAGAGTVGAYTASVSGVALEVVESDNAGTTSLDFDSGNPESARTHYESALKIARSISYRAVLIEALLARGRFYAKANVGATRPAKTETAAGIEGSPLPLTDAFNDLNEALNYAVEGGYRIYEADIRVALAWAHLNSPRPLAGEGQGVRAAKVEAERALQMSQEMGYHWGVVDAEEVLDVIARRVE